MYVYINTKNVSIKQTNPTVINDVFSIDVNSRLICNNLYSYQYTLEQITEQIKELQKYVKENKLKISGNITLANDTVLENYKITKKKFSKIDGEVELTTRIKKERVAKKTPTFDEKINLVCLYCQKKNELPKSDTIYENEKIGKFWIDVKKNKNGFDKIMENIR